MDTQSPYSTVELADGVDDLCQRALGIGRILSDMAACHDDLNYDARAALDFLGHALTTAACRVAELDGSRADLD